MSVATQNIPGTRVRRLSSYHVRGADPYFGMRVYLQGWSFIPLLLWLGMWANLNTGSWHIYNVYLGLRSIFDDVRSLNEWQLFIRAAIPYLALPLSLVFLGLDKHKLPFMKASPNMLLMIYGCIAAIATIWSPAPEFSVYWSLTFLAGTLCTWVMVKQGQPLLSSRLMLEATWVICFVSLLILAYLGRQSIFSNQSEEMGYAVINDLSGMSRASGVSRWAAVPGLVFFLRAFMSKGARWRIAYLAASLFCLYVVYRVQSRGSLFGVIGALLFAALYGKHFQRKFVFVLFWLMIAATAYVSVAASGNFEIYGQKFSGYVHRGQNEQDFQSMSGRTDFYQRGLEVIWESPLLGTGQWTDRLNPKINGHIHNTALQALLNAGIIGFIPYIASWIVGWMLFFRLWRNDRLLSPIDHRLLLEAGVVMAFFTVRAIPETTTASFSVDLMVMLTVYCYLEALGLQVLKPAPSRNRLASAKMRAMEAF